MLVEVLELTNAPDLLQATLMEMTRSPPSFMSPHKPKDKKTFQLASNSCSLSVNQVTTDGIRQTGEQRGKKEAILGSVTGRGLSTLTALLLSSFFVGITC